MRKTLIVWAFLAWISSVLNPNVVSAQEMVKKDTIEALTCPWNQRLIVIPNNLHNSTIIYQTCEPSWIIIDTKNILHEIWKCWKNENLDFSIDISDDDIIVTQTCLPDLSQ